MNDVMEKVLDKARICVYGGDVVDFHAFKTLFSNDQCYSDTLTRFKSALADQLGENEKAIALALFSFDEYFEDQGVVIELEDCLLKTLKLLRYSKNESDEGFEEAYKNFPLQVKCAVLYEVLKEQNDNLKDTIDELVGMGF